MPALLMRRSVQWALICAGWIFVAVFYTSQSGLQALYAGAAFPWWRVLRGELVYAFIWILLTLAVIRLDRRFPLDAGRWRKSLLVHLAASSIVATLHPPAMVALIRGLGWGTDPSRPFWDVAKLSIVGWFHLNLTFYWGILGVRYILS